MSDIVRDSDWAETHFEVVARITYHLLNDEEKVIKVYDEGGRGRLWELAEDITNEFQELHKDTVWDGEYFEVVDAFIEKKLSEIE